MRRVMDLNKPWSLNVSYTVDVLYDIGKKGILSIHSISFGFGK